MAREFLRRVRSHPNGTRPSTPLAQAAKRGGKIAKAHRERLAMAGMAPVVLAGPLIGAAMGDVAPDAPPEGPPVAPKTVSDIDAKFEAREAERKAAEASRRQLEGQLANPEEAFRQVVPKQDLISLGGIAGAASFTEVRETKRAVADVYDTHLLREPTNEETLKYQELIRAGATPAEIAEVATDVVSASDERPLAIEVGKVFTEVVGRAPTADEAASHLSAMKAESLSTGATTNASANLRRQLRESDEGRLAFLSNTYASVTGQTLDASHPKLPEWLGTEASLRQQGSADVEAARQIGIHMANTVQLISGDQLRQVIPKLTPEQADTQARYLSQTMREFDITTPNRKAMFLAQLAHESGGLVHFEEIASGAAYEGRSDLGNTQPGDGVRFKGRGPIQITGRANYTTASRDLGVNLVATPELAARPDIGYRLAGWFWQSRNLNSLADANDFLKMTKRINGGYNGLADRERYLSITRGLFGA